jgi:hypothetical protein
MVYKTQILDAVRPSVNSPEEREPALHRHTHTHTRKWPFFAQDMVSQWMKLYMRNNTRIKKLNFTHVITTQAGNEDSYRTQKLCAAGGRVPPHVHVSCTCRLAPVNIPVSFQLAEAALTPPSQPAL